MVHLSAHIPNFEVANMAFVFVQFWGPLPTINEVFMGDTPPASQPTGDLPNTPQGTHSLISQSSSRGPFSETETRARPPVSSAQSPQPGYPPIQAYSSQQHIHHARPEGFNMTALGNMLPDQSYQGYGQVPPQRYPQGPASPGLLYQLQSVPQYNGAPNISPSSATYGIQFQGQFQGMYGASSATQHLQPGTAPSSQFYHNQGFLGQPQQQGSPYLIQPNQYGPGSQIYTGSPSQYGMRGNFSGENRLSGQQHATEYLGSSAGGPTGRSNSIGKWQSAF